MAQARRLVSLAVVGMLVLASSPLAAFMTFASGQKVPVVRGDTFKIRTQLGQVALCDGSVRLPPGAYEVEIVSKGDGSVRASFFDKDGRKAGERAGVIFAIRQIPSVPGTDPSDLRPPEPGSQTADFRNISPSLPSIPPSPTPPPSPTFTKLGFGPNSRSSFSQAGQKLELQILSKDETHVILIGLLLPAVQKVREAPVKP